MSEAENVARLFEKYCFTKPDRLGITTFPNPDCPSVLEPQLPASKLVLESLARGEAGLFSAMFNDKLALVEGSWQYWNGREWVQDNAVVDSLVGLLANEYLRLAQQMLLAAEQTDDLVAKERYGVQALLLYQRAYRLSAEQLKERVQAEHQ